MFGRIINRDTYIGAVKSVEVKYKGVKVKVKGLG